MRVLFLCRNRFEKTAGGVVEFLHYLPPALQRYGVEVVIYDMGNANDCRLEGPRYLPNGIANYSGPQIKPSLFVARKKLQPLLDVCQLEKIDLIHAQGTYRSGFVAWHASRINQLPYMVMSHGDITTINSARMERANVRRRCQKILRAAVGVTHLTPMMADASHQIYDTKNKSTIIANGIDLKSWQPLQHLPEKNYLFALGRLEREKGFHILIDAYAQLHNQGIKSSLVIAGHGTQAAALHAQARGWGLNVVTDYQDIDAMPAASVIFPGYVKGELKNQLIAHSLAVLFPTQPALWEEPFGIVQIEAMAAGKSVVASDSATTRYLQGLGLCARLARADDAADWAQEIASLLADESTRRQWGQMNLNNVQQFDWDVIARAYQAMYFAAGNKKGELDMTLSHPYVSVVEAKITS